MRQRLFALISFALTLGISSAALAQQDITLVAPGGGVTNALNVLLPQYEAKTGTKFTLTSSPGPLSKKQAADGSFDLSIVQAPFPEVLASENVDVKSRTPLADMAVGVAVKAGSPKPDISTAASVKAMLLSAKAIAYPDPGTPAGSNFENTLNKLGIADQVHAKALHAKGGGAGAMALVAKGDADIGLTFLSEMSDPGVEVVGPLPEAISERLPVVGFISTHSKNQAAAKALLVYLSSRDAVPVYVTQKMLAVAK